MTRTFEEFQSQEQSLDEKIAASDPDLRRFVIALKAENERLHKQLVQMEAQRVVVLKRIAALETKIGHDHASNGSPG